MESKTNYTLVGIVVLILLFGLVTSALWLSVGFDNKKYKTYAVYMREPVTGLNTDALVKFNGVKVGMVSKIELSPLDPQQVMVLLNIEDHTPITVSTEASLVNQGITGVTYMGLSATSKTFTPLKKRPGDPYPIIHYKPSLLYELEKNIAALSSGLKEFLSKDNAKNFGMLLSNLKKISAVFADNGPAISKTLADMPILIQHLKSGVDEFSHMSVNVSHASKQFKTTLQTGKQTLDQLSQQAIPPAVLLLQRLDSIAANLQQLSVDVRNNPAVLLHGSTPPPKGPGE